MLEPAIRRGKIGSLIIYEISESELQQLEKGNPDSIFLTLSIALLSIAISFTTTLLTTKIDNDRLFLVFISLTIISYIIGIILGIIWFGKRKTTKSIVKSIKSRLPPEGIPEK